jgi:hypothetical protein
MFIRIDKYIIGVSTVNDITDCYTRFFRDFPSCTGFNSFTKFKMTTWKLPRIVAVRTDPLTQQQPVTLPYHDTYTNMRPCIQLIINVINSMVLTRISHQAA